MKTEPDETSLRRNGCSGSGITINEGRRRQPSPPPRGHLRLVRPKTEPGMEATPTPVAVKQEHLDMAADDETALKWARNDYVREEMVRQRRALEEIAARRRGREEGGVVILDDSDEDAPRPSNVKLHRLGDPGQGCSRDGCGVQDGGDDNDGDDDGDDDDGGDYTAFYSLLGM